MRDRDTRVAGFHHVSRSRGISLPFNRQNCLGADQRSRFDPETVGSNGIGSRRRRFSFAVMVFDRGQSVLIAGKDY